MRIFISWSKERSREFAQIIRDWLPEVIQEVEPWMSSEDIDKGKRWSEEIAARLDEVNEGIVCVTADNAKEPWLNFEAGALAKSRADATVRPLLLDVGKADVVGPLAEFQMTAVLDADDMWLFVKSVNGRCERHIEETRLRRAFDRVWPELHERLERLATSATPAAEKTPARGADEMFAEVLERIRQIERVVTAPPADEPTASEVASSPRRSRAEALDLMERIEPGWHVKHISLGEGVVQNVYKDGYGRPTVLARYRTAYQRSRLAGPYIVSVTPPGDADTQELVRA